MRTVRLLLIVTIAFCFARTAYTYRNLDVNNLDDFYVYDTAAALVSQHAGADIYDGADTGEDPQFRFNAPDSVFGAAARRLGVPAVRMYVYPPLLADLLTPMAWLSARVAGYVWLVLNVGMLLFSAFLLTRLLRVRWRSGAALAVLAGLFGMFSVALAFEAGQITILLLLLWVLGLYCYGRGWLLASGCAVALATSIKLTPLIAVIPFLIWRDWRWLRAFGLSLAVFFGAMFAINGRAVLLDYFLHVMPAMSQGVPHLENRSIAAALEILYRALHGGSFVGLQATGPGPMAHWVLLLGKLIPLCVLAAVALWVYRTPKSISVDRRMEIVAAFALLSVILSPVSWFHAFVVCYPLLVLLWSAALRERWPRVQVVLLTLCSLDLGAALINGVRQRTANTVGASLLTFGTPLVVLLTVALALNHASEETQAVSA